MKKNYIELILLFFSLTVLSAQSRKPVNSGDYLKMRWERVATDMPSEWYGSDEAKLVAENVLISQREMGGWEKNEPYHHHFSDSLKAHYLKAKTEKGGTFDNGSTISELRFLAKVYAHVREPRYKQAFEKGVNYIFLAQYGNGGWPQYFPVKDPESEILLDKTVPYSMHITYNDNAMVNIMTLLKQIFTGNKEFAALKIDQKTKEKARQSFDKGIECILKTQIIVNHQPTVWCAQHDEKTFAPANARAYELASFSGAESVGIVLLLMDIDHPSKKIIEAVDGAEKWFEAHEIKGIKIGSETDENGRPNRVVIEDNNASPVWARFYDLETEKPFFCSRDGVKRSALADISYERRNGYSWYTNAPEKIVAHYSEWRKKNHLSK